MSDRSRALLFLLAGWGLLVAYFSVTTPPSYRDVPLGDARVYTLMALHYDNPAAVQEPLPLMYAGRLLPAAIAGWMASPAQTKGSATREFQELRGSLPANRSVLRAFVKLNLLTSFLTVYFLFLVFELVGFKRHLSIALSLSWMSLYLAQRLYVFWPQMTDPCGFALLTAMIYALLSRRRGIFLAFTMLAPLIRENLLFLVPCLWLDLRGESRRRRFLYGAASLLPFVLFLFLRARPYFHAAVLRPNGVHDIAILPWFASHVPMFPDYVDIAFFNLRRLAKFQRWLLWPLLFVYGFGGFSFVLLAAPRKSWAALKRYHFLWPFIVLTLAAGGLTTDRYLFYLFPLVLLIAGHVLSDKFPDSRRLLGMMAALVLANFVLYDHFLIPTQQGAEHFAYFHQVEAIGGLSGFERGLLLAKLAFLGVFLGAVWTKLNHRTSPGIN